MKLLTALIALTFLIGSCCKAECLDASVFVTFSNFRVHQTDTLLLVRYKPGTGQTTVVDSVWRFLPNLPGSDTARSYHSENITAGTDWKIVIPAVNRTFWITDISLRTAKCCGSRSAVVRDFKLNGTLKQGSFLQLE